MTMTLNFLTIQFYESYKRIPQAKNSAITSKDYKYNINVPKDTLTKKHLKPVHYSYKYYDV